MAKKPTKKEKDKSELMLFMSRVGLTEATSKYVKDVKDNELDQDTRIKARKEVAKIGYIRYAETTPEDTPGRLNSFDPMNAQQYTAAERNAKELSDECSILSADQVRHRLEDLVGGFEKNQLEALFGDEKTSKALQAATSQDYAPWALQYLNIKKLEEFEGKAKKGNLSKEEKAQLTDSLVKRNMEIARVRAKEAGLKDPALIDARIEASRYNTLFGFDVNDKAYKEVVDSALKGSREALKEYEEESGQDIHGYMTETLKTMSAGEGVKNVKKLLYNAGSVKPK